MNKRHATRYPGVRARESLTRKYKGKPDVCFTIDYRDRAGKRIRKDVGWASEGFTATLANEIRSQLIHDEKMQAITGQPSTTLPSMKFKDAWERYKQDWLIANGKDTKPAASIITNYLQSIMELPLEKITPYQIDKIMNDMRLRGLSTQSIRLAVSLVRSIMRKMVKWKFFSGHLPFDEIVLPKLNNQVCVFSLRMKPTDF